MLIRRNFLESLAILAKIEKKAQAAQDVRTLLGVNSILFGPQSWDAINKFVNVLNNGLNSMALTQKIGNKTVNFQSVVMTPTGDTRFVGSLKVMFDLSQYLWSVITNKRNQVYSVQESKDIVAKISNMLSSSDFPEPSAQAIKSNLTAAINNWQNIL